MGVPLETSDQVNVGTQNGEYSSYFSMVALQARWLQTLQILQWEKGAAFCHRQSPCMLTPAM